MKIDIRAKKLTAAAGNRELVNTLSTGLGLPACTDATSFISMLDERISAGKMELAKLASMRDSVAKLLGRRRICEPWTPGANTLYTRILGLLQQHATLTRPQISDLLAAEDAGEVLIGSVYAALSKLAETGWIEGNRTGWRLAGADTGTAE